MEIREYEVRDRATFIPCLAIRVSGETYLTQRAGYGDPCILFGRLEGGTFMHASYQWNDRTMKVAHSYIEQHWPESGSVIDVEYILGETSEQKVSEQYSS